MSTQRKPEFVDDEISEQPSTTISTPSRLFRTPQRIAASLQLPHGPKRPVSLVERQVSMLRQKEIKHATPAQGADRGRSRERRAFSQDSRTDDAVARGATTCKQSIAFETGMRSGFGADQSILVLFGDPTMFEDVDAGRFFRVMPR